MDPLMANALLANAYAPTTFSFGFVQSPFAEFSEAFISWQKEISSKFGVGIEFTHFSAPLPVALSRLEPLTTPLDRYLLVETRSNWSAIFSNGLRVNDVASPVGYLPTVLKCRGLNVASIPDRSDKAGRDGLQVYGAVTFTLCGPEKTDWMNRIRHVGVTKDVGGWEFAAQGEIQPYENAECYLKRRLVDRFTVEMLESYCRALGIELFDANFFGGRCLLSHAQRSTPPGPTMSIAEARSHLYL
jgi:hypothetical protein